MPETVLEVFPITDDASADISGQPSARRRCKRLVLVLQAAGGTPRNVSTESLSSVVTGGIVDRHPSGRRVDSGGQQGFGEKTVAKGDPAVHDVPRHDMLDMEGHVTGSLPRLDPSVVSRDKLTRRSEAFARGEWNDLLNASRLCVEQAATAQRSGGRRAGGEEKRRAQRALALIQMGVLSSVRQALEGATVAPGTVQTREALQDAFGDVFRVALHTLPIRS